MPGARGPSRDAGRAPLWPGGQRAAPIDVLGIGQTSGDRVCVLGRLPPPGGKAELSGYREGAGGQIATAALACARLGLRTAYVGAVGDDEAGKAALAPLRQAAVDVAGVVRRRATASRSAVVVVDSHGERIVLAHREPGLRLRPADLERSRIEAARLLLLDAEDPEAATWAARIARGAGVPVVLDADRPAAGLQELLDNVDFPIVSRGFAETFSRDRWLSEGLRELAAGARLAAVTLGSEGCVARVGDRVIAWPAFAVEALDTTGAGDVFHAGFAWALLGGAGAEDALRTAGAAAAMACRSIGAQAGLPTADALAAFLHEHA